MKEKWNIKRIEEICDILDHKRKPITQKDRVAGEFPYYGATGILGYVHDFIFDERLVLIGEDGAKWNSGDRTAFIADGKYWVNNHAHVIKPKREAVLDEWIIYFLNHSDLTPFITGLTVPKLNQAKLRSIELPVPPLKEQKQIVAILDEAFEAIDKAKANIKKNIENAEELFQAKLEIVFKEILINHGEYALNSFCEVKDGTHDSPKYVSENGIPFVTQKNVTVFGLDFSDVKLISKTDHDNFYRRSNVALGDILISMIGANRGMACLVNDKRLFSIKNVGLIKENKDKYNSDYLLFFLKSNLAKKYVSENSSGSAQGFIGLTKLREFPIPFTDLRAQNKIADELVRFESSTRKCIERYNQKILMLESLKKSILQKAFTGELIVDKVGV